MTVFRWLVLGAVLSGLAAACALGVFVARAMDFTPPERVAAISLDEGPPGGRAVFRPERRFLMEPVPALTVEWLAGQRLALITQLRPQTHAEAIDLWAWVAEGGRALVYTGHGSDWDGSVRWPAGIDHKPALRLQREAGTRAIGFGLAGRVARPGRWTAPPPCRVSNAGLIADCSIGRGRVLLVASSRLAPTAANPLAAADDRNLLAAALLRALADGAPLPADARDPQARNIGWATAGGVLSLIALVFGICAGLTAARPKRAREATGVARTTRSNGDDFPV